MVESSHPVVRMKDEPSPDDLATARVDLNHRPPATAGRCSIQLSYDARYPVVESNHLVPPYKSGYRPTARDMVAGAGIEPARTCV
jgi:hypothetical protein